MAVSTIKNTRLIREDINIPITWGSTSSSVNWTQEVDATKSGYMLIAVSYNVGGSGGTNIVGQARIISDTTVYCTARALSAPSSLTANTFRLTATYQPI